MHNPLDIACFTIVLSNGHANPLGIGPAPVILINNSFPGPTLSLNHNQLVRFTVVNNMTSEDTAIHFHGISQKDTPWSDGVPGVTQLPVQPGETYVYEWRADEPGVYFYHSHRKGQIQDGTYGAIVVKPGRDVERPFHLISEGEDVDAMVRAEENLVPLLISDWTQFYFEEVMKMQKEANIDWNCFDGVIVNGVGAQYCTSRQELDDMTSPQLRRILEDAGYPEGLTNKGCVPPISLFQGDFERNLSILPPTVYDQCIGGKSERANYTIDVLSQDRWAALTFINSGGLYPLKVTIDSHEMWVYAVDGRYIYPVLVDQIMVTNGARLSVLIRLDQQPGRYVIRISTALMGQVLSGYADLVYDDSTTSVEEKPGIDYAGRPLRDLRLWDDDMAKPFPPIRPARKADRTFKLSLRKQGLPHGAWEWTIGDAQHKNVSPSFLETLDPPLLYRPVPFLADSPLILTTNNNEWIDLIFLIQSSSPTHPQSMPHPMHKHGNKVFVLGSGIGSFPWPSVAEAPQHLFNFEDPPLRDSWYTPSDPEQDTWMMVRYKVEQVGAWAMHCHVQTHFSGGMAAVLVDGVEEWEDVMRGGMSWVKGRRDGRGEGG